MRCLLLLAALAACHQHPDGYGSTGTLMFEPREPAAADTMLATETEVLRSATVLARVKQEFQADLSADAIEIERRPGAMILAVTVHDKDPARAAQLCNQLIRTYIDYRMAAAITPVMEQIEALSQELERQPDNAKLRDKLTELELARTSRTLDVRPLDPCVVPR